MLKYICAGVSSDIFGRKRFEYKNIQTLLYKKLKFSILSTDSNQNIWDTFVQDISTD